MEYTNSLVRTLIEEHIHSLRDRQVLCRRLIDGATLDNLAAEFDLSVSQVKRIIRKNEPIIFKHYPKVT